MRTKIIMIGALLIAMAGCSKNESKEEDVPPDCKLSIINTGTRLTSILYNNNGRISRIAHSDGILEEYTYRGDTARILKTNNGIFSSRVIVIYNSNGLAEKVRTERNPAGTIGEQMEFSYNGIELVQALEKEIGSAPTTLTVYNWQNGNLREIISGSSVTLIDYYEDELARPGNYMDLLNIFQGFEIYRTKNLVKSIGDGNSLGLFNYNFDGNGLITEAVITGDGSSVFTYTYQCE